MINTSRVSEPPISERNDEQLAEDFQHGNRQAFDELMLRHRQKIFVVCMRYLRRLDHAEDVTQDVFLALLTKRARYRAEGPFRAFLVAVAKRKCGAELSRREAKLRIKTQSLDCSAPVVDRGDSPLEVIVAREQLRIATDILAQLPARQSQALHLRFAQGLTFQQIGHTMGFTHQYAQQLIGNAVKSAARMFDTRPRPRRSPA